MNVGYGFGRVEVVTVSANCADRTKMWLNCRYVRPFDPTGNWVPRNWICLGGERCLPHERRGLYAKPDAGCIVLSSPSGTKGDGDLDNHACSSGIKINNDPIYVLSSISTDNSKFGSSIISCEIVKSGTKERIYQRKPCPQTSVLLKLAAKTTYQACVDTAVAFAKVSVGFTWHLDSPGMTRRGLHGGKPLSEMFTIVGNNITADADDGFRIVIGNGD